MRYSLMLLKFIGKGVANAVGGGIAGDLLFEVVPEVAADVYKWWKKDRKPEEQQADLAGAGQRPPRAGQGGGQANRRGSRRRQAAGGQEGTGGLPQPRPRPASQVAAPPFRPNRHHRRPGSGAPERREDIIPLLPTKLPRFKPGDRPCPASTGSWTSCSASAASARCGRRGNPLLDGMPPVALKFCLDPSAGQYLRNEAAVLEPRHAPGPAPGHRHPGGARTCPPSRRAWSTSTSRAATWPG